MQRKLTDIQAEEIRDCHHAGERMRSLAERYDVSYDVIRQILTGRTYKLAGGKIGLCEAAMGPKLRDEDVMAIRNLIRDGMPTLDMAIRFKVDRRTIFEVATGKRYSHLNSICKPVELTGKVADARRKLKRVARQGIIDYFNGDNPALTMTEVANLYGVSLSYISYIVAGKR